MKKLSTANISPLEIEIENKISTAYLFSIAAKTQGLDPIRLFGAQCTDASTTPPQQTNQFINNKINNNGNKNRNDKD